MHARRAPRPAAAPHAESGNQPQRLGEGILIAEGHLLAGHHVGGLGDLLAHQRCAGGGHHHLRPQLRQLELDVPLDVVAGVDRDLLGGEAREAFGGYPQQVGARHDALEAIAPVNVRSGGRGGAGLARVEHDGGIRHPLSVRVGERAVDGGRAKSGRGEQRTRESGWAGPRSARAITGHRSSHVSSGNCQSCRILPVFRRKIAKTVSGRSPGS